MKRGDLASFIDFADLVVSVHRNAFNYYQSKHEGINPWNRVDFIGGVVSYGRSFHESRGAYHI
jgi:hypothetical protein